MRNKTTRFLSFLLAACLLLTVVPPGSLRAEADAKTYKTGDIITFGGYPQTKVTDSGTVSALNAISKNWISYRYYRSTGETAQPGDWMRYADISYHDIKYRAVTFDSYRPIVISDDSSSAKSKQDDHGYVCGKIYYFEYEPLHWRVLDPGAGLVLCESVVDAQPYQNTIYYNSSTKEYYQDRDSSVYANDYATSSIRRWLIDDFYNTAFSSDEKALIADTKLDNSAALPSDAKYNSASTTDKIILLSYDDMLNPSYGFSSHYKFDDPLRQAKGTDYARCQGLYEYSGLFYSGVCDWRLRSPGFSSKYAANVIERGFVDSSGAYVDNSIDGIRPAFCFSAGISEDNNPRGGFVLPGDVDGNGKVEAADARLALRAAVGLEKYAKGSAKFLAADVNNDGVITAEDARLILRAAVGLERLK